MNPLTIDKHIPPPPSRASTQGGVRPGTVKHTVHIAAMACEIGDSFYAPLPPTYIHSVLKNAKAAGRGFRARKEGLGIRVWRVK